MSKGDKLLAKACAEISRTGCWQRVYEPYVKEASKSGNWYNASCPLPSHRGTDDRPSFGYNVIEGTYNCFVCGGGDAVGFLMNMGLSFEEAKKRLIQVSGLKTVDSSARYEKEGYFPKKRTNGGVLKYVEGYIYLNKGAPVYRKNRYERETPSGREKVFDFWRYKEGKWRLSSKEDPLTQGDRVLYNSEAVETAKKEGAPLFIVEGEKDVNTLKRLGLYAVTAGGVNEWQERFSRGMEGLCVYVIPDNDLPGLKASKRIMADLLHKSINAMQLSWEAVSEKYGYPGEAKPSHGEDITDLYKYLKDKGVHLTSELIIQFCVTESTEDKAYDMPIFKRRR